MKTLKPNLKELHRKNCKDLIENGDVYGRTLENMSLSKEMNADIQHNLNNHLSVIKMIFLKKNELTGSNLEIAEARLELIETYLRGLELYTD